MLFKVKNEGIELKLIHENRDIEHPTLKKHKRKLDQSTEFNEMTDMTTSTDNTISTEQKQSAEHDYQEISSSRLNFNSPPETSQFFRK